MIFPNRFQWFNEPKFEPKFDAVLTASRMMENDPNRVFQTWKRFGKSMICRYVKLIKLHNLCKILVYPTWKQEKYNLFHILDILFHLLGRPSSSHSWRLQATVKGKQQTRESKEKSEFGAPAITFLPRLINYPRPSLDWISSSAVSATLGKTTSNKTPKQFDIWPICSSSYFFI